MKASTRTSIESYLLRLWQKKSLLHVVLTPLSWLYGGGLWLRKKCHPAAQHLPVPVVVVGNLTVGGNGKTPVTIALVQHLQAQGYHPGVISRGYGRKPTQNPVAVTKHSNPSDTGDEPKEIFMATGCPVYVHEKRYLAAQTLLAEENIDVIISDDGWQHLALHANISVVVMGKNAPLGNGLLLPAGPLREPTSRLHDADFIVMQHNTAQAHPHSFHVAPLHWVHLKTGEKRALSTIHSGVAVSSIAKPERFWQTLDALHVDYQKHPFADHHNITRSDLAPLSGEALLMTRKDAVKCQAFATDNMWYLEVVAYLPDNVLKGIEKKLSEYDSIGKNINQTGAKP